MYLRYGRTILVACLAAFLIIITGCGGSTSSSGNSPTNPGTPANPGTPGGNPGGGGGGGSPQSSTFFYVQGTRFGAPDNTFAFRLNSDGSTAPVPGSPFANPQQVFTQAGKFLVGHDSSGLQVALYPVDASTGAPQSPVSISNVPARVAVADAADVYSSTPGKGGNGGISALSIADGKLTPVPGSPFFAPGEASDYFPLYLTSSLLFVGRFTDPLAPNAPPTQSSDVTVFSRNANGALSRFTSIGLGNSVFSLAVHPSMKFIYKLDLDSSSSCTLNVFSFDVNSGASTLVQQMTLDCRGAMGADKQGRYLFLPGKSSAGVHVFSIDQNSGRVNEVGGSPFFAGDSTIFGAVVEPSGQFVLILRGNSFQTATIDASTGKLTAVGSPVAISTDAIGGVTFAVF